MSLIEKTPAIAISHTEIEQDHHEFITLINQMEDADNQTFIGLFDELMQHTQKHFERENQLMEQFKFPAITEHQGEHHRVLAEFNQFKRLIDKGMISIGRTYIKERVPQWFILHVTTMDAALDAHMKRVQSS